MRVSPNAMPWEEWWAEIRREASARLGRSLGPAELNAAWWRGVYEDGVTPAVAWKMAASFYEK